jgi:hypothetical protein
MNGRKASVPLWVALKLKKLKECTIILPEYLIIDYLEGAIASESESADLTGLPPFFGTISHLLLNEAKEDFGNNFLEIAKLIDDLESLRRKKIEKFFRNFESSSDLILV